MIFLGQGAHPKISKSQPKEMRTDNEGCSSWAQGQGTTGVVETAAEMHRKKDKDTKPQSQTEGRQKNEEEMGVCMHSFNPDSY